MGCPHQSNRPIKANFKPFNFYWCFDCNSVFSDAKEAKECLKMYIGQAIAENSPWVEYLLRESCSCMI